MERKGEEREKERIIAGASTVSISFFEMTTGF